MELQDKVKRLLAANATLRETIKAKDKEIDSLQSLNDFQQQQISCMQSEIEAKDDEIETKDDELDGWKRLNDYYLNLEAQIQATKSCTNCQSYNAQGEYSKCHLHIDTALNCLDNNFSVWRQR